MSKAILGHHLFNHFKTLFDLLNLSKTGNPLIIISITAEGIIPLSQIRPIHKFYCQ